MMPASTPSPKRDAERSRQAILAAAQALFAERGFSATGIRDIAAASGFSPALVIRYFDNKENILRAALDEVLVIGPLIDGPRDTFGERVATLYDRESETGSPFAMIMLATADPSARELCRDLLHSRVTIPLSRWLGGDDGATRAARLQTLWMGYFTARQLLRGRVEQADGSHRWLASMTQAIAFDPPLFRTS